MASLLYFSKSGFPDATIEDWVHWVHFNTPKMSQTFFATLAGNDLYNCALVVTQLSRKQTIRTFQRFRKYQFFPLLTSRQFVHLPEHGQNVARHHTRNFVIKPSPFTKDHQTSGVSVNQQNIACLFSLSPTQGLIYDNNSYFSWLDTIVRQPRGVETT